MRQITVQNEEETKAIGKKIAKILKPGDILCLNGDLGAGKTTLTKSIAEGLGIEEMVVSPTFNIVREYTEGRLPLYHFDVYRITDIDEMYELGHEEYFYGNGVCIIEWAEQITSLLPSHSMQIDIAYGACDAQRIYTVGDELYHEITGN